MTEFGDSSSAQLPIHAHHNRRRRRRNSCCLPSLICLSLLLLLALLAVILAFTVFKPRDPQTQLISAKVSGISPRVTFPIVHLDLNVTLDLEILVYNPNRESFAHVPGKTRLLYRGTQVGDADVGAGRIPSRGSEQLMLRMTVEVDKLANSQELRGLIGDVLAGEVGFDATTRIPGRVTFLGFIKHHAVATSECHVVVGVPDMRVKSQECTQKTKL